MQQDSDWHPKYVSMKEGNISAESDLDSGQDVNLDNHSATLSNSKDSEVLDTDLTYKEDSNFDSEHESFDDTLKESEPDAAAVRDYFGGRAEVPDNWNQLKRPEKLKILKNFNRVFLPNIPDTLMSNVAGSMISGDSGRLPSEVPDWLDKEKFERGQRFARDNIIGVSFAKLMGLYAVYTFEDSLKPMIITRKSSEPYTAFKRFLSTLTKMKNWYTSDPWTEGTPAYNDMQTARKLHTMVRRKLNNLSHTEIDKLAEIDRVMSEQKDMWVEDFRESCPEFKPGQCPYVILELRKTRAKGLSQGEMGFTMFAFFAFPILFPEAFGIHNATDEDLEAFVHLWRGLGYLLGIEDEFNFCQGTFEETKQRCADFLECFVKPNLRNINAAYEHMMRCIFEGISFYFPILFYDTALLYLADLMELKMPRLRASMSYNSWIRYHGVRFLTYKLSRFTSIQAFVNKIFYASLDRAWKFDSNKHIALQKKSDEIIAKVLDNTAQKKPEVSVSSLYGAPFTFIIGSLIFLFVKIIWISTFF